MNWVVAPSKDIVCKVGRVAVVARYNAEKVRELVRYHQKQAGINNSINLSFRWKILWGCEAYFSWHETVILRFDWSIVDADWLNSMLSCVKTYASSVVSPLESTSIVSRDIYN